MRGAGAARPLAPRSPIRIQDLRKAGSAAWEKIYSITYSHITGEVGVAYLVHVDEETELAFDTAQDA